MSEHRNKSARQAIIASLCLGFLICLPATAEVPSLGDADEMLAKYFESETVMLRDKCLADIESLDDWKNKRGVYRRQLFDMVGLDPLPEKTDLKPVITGKVEHEQFIVENLHFQSRPGLYVTANLYIPKGLQGPAPTILYVCGHGPVKKDGVSYGNKVSYQHHGAWFARNGYVCLAIDSLQLGEIESIHHGTYRYEMWWWNNRGYTPAGVEAWNCIRALDYLETREEVDKTRFGVTGRSGGGAYSWWISALDDRIKAAVPVAGITDLHNHVIDGTVEGHCDCMFFLNTYRWDYPLVAALVVPRPLLISNSDKDKIFPLDGVYRTHEKVARIYRLFEADEKLGLHITEGPHKDTQELRIHAFVWFNRFLKSDSSLIDTTATAFFEPEQLKVFDELPEDQINTEIHESFVAKAENIPDPASVEATMVARQKMIETLRTKCFGGWPGETGELSIEKVFSARHQGVRITAYDFTSQPHVRLRIYLAQKATLTEPKQLILKPISQEDWDVWAPAAACVGDELLGGVEPDKQLFAELRKTVFGTDAIVAYVAPRGVGLSAWDVDERKLTQIRRRFMLLGQTLDGMRVWDIRRAIQTLRHLDETAELPLTIEASGVTAVMTMYASLFEGDIDRLKLANMPESHRDGPFILNISRYLTMDMARAMASRNTSVTADLRAPIKKGGL